MKIGTRRFPAILGIYAFFHIFMVPGAARAGSQGDLLNGEKQRGASITRFKVEPLYRAVRLSWKAKIRSKVPVIFKIYRSIATAKGPYRLIGSIPYKRRIKRYRYVDKHLPVEENYFYVIEVPATGERFGPLQARPPFSLPTT